MNENALRERLLASAVQEGQLHLLPLAAEKALADEFAVSRRHVQIAALEAHILPARYQRSLGTVGWDNWPCSAPRAASSAWAGWAAGSWKDWRAWAWVVSSSLTATVSPRTT